MAPGLEQAAALDRKQRGAADRQLGAELLGLEPGVRGGHGSRGCRGGRGQRGRLPRGEQSLGNLWLTQPERASRPLIELRHLCHQIAANSRPGLP